MKTETYSPAAMRGMVGLPFEEFSVGDEWWTPARTVTEADIHGFAQFSGDWNPHHVDALFAKASDMGTRIAHGTLVITICSGLFLRLRIFEQTIVALLDLHYRFLAPTVIGTRLQAHVKVIEARATSNPDRGIVTFEVSGVNEHDEPVAIGEWKILMLRRDALDRLIARSGDPNAVRAVPAQRPVGA